METVGEGGKVFPRKSDDDCSLSNGNEEDDGDDGLGECLALAITFRMSAISSSSSSLLSSFLS